MSGEWGSVDSAMTASRAAGIRPSCIALYVPV